MPLIKARLLVPAGSVHEAEKNAGIASVALGFLNNPSADAFNKTGVRVSARASEDMTVISSSGLSSYLDTILRGIERLVITGSVNQERIDDYKKNYERNFTRESFNRNRAYQVEIAKALYGEKHPYTTKGSPTKESVSSLGKDEAMSFIRQYVRPNGATLIVVGNFDATYAKKMIAENFSDHGNWSGGEIPKRAAAEGPAQTEPNVFGVVGDENKAQIVTRVMYRADAGIDEKMGLRMILAEMLNTRMGEVRTKLASGYTVGGGFAPAVGPSRYVFSGEIDREKIGETVKFMRHQVESLRTGSESFNEEFAAARRVVLKKLLAESTETGFVASQLTRIALYGLDVNAFETLQQSVAGATPKQIKELMAYDLAPEREIVALQGPKSILVKAFADAGIENAKIIEPQI